MSEDTLPHRKQQEEPIYWIYAVRIILSICLIYYHNHRMVDSYRHNLSLNIPDEYDTLRSLIKAGQRAVLQAGLNLVNIIFKNL